MLYDDDGQSLGYRDASDPRLILINFAWDDSARRLTLEPGVKKWPGGTRNFKVEVIGSNAQSKQIEFRGEKLEVSL